MKICLLFCFFFFLTYSISFSQIGKVDSVINLYQKCKVDTAKIDFLLKNAELLIDADSKKLIYYGEDALKIAQKLDDKKRQEYLMRLISQGYQQIGKIAEAIDYINENIKLAALLNDQNGIAVAKMNLGVCYNQLGNFSLAIEYYKNCLAYFSKRNETIYVCECYIALSDSYFKSNNPDKSLFYIARAEKVSLRKNNYLLDYVYTNFAESYFLKNDFKLAKEYALKGIAISQPADNLYALSAEYLVIAKVSLALNDFSNATLFTKKGLKLAEETDFKENLINAYDIFSQLLEKEKKYAEALKYKSLYINSKLKVQTSVNNNISQAYENLKNDEELAEIKAKNLKKDAAIKSERFLIIIITLTLLMVICIAALIYYSGKKIKQSNQELIEKNEKISSQAEHIVELNRLKDRLLSIVSHDLRSPLNNLKGMLDLVINGHLTQDRFQTIIPQLNKGVYATLDLLENLLQWSKSQMKGFIVSPKKIDLYALAEIQLNLFEKQLEEKFVTIKNNIPVNTMAFADKDMIDVVFRNLVANAIKFCKANDVITIASSLKDNCIEISVADTGTGITEANMKKIFHVENTFTTIGTNNEKGTGLGLLLCKEFVETNKGCIRIESKENIGTQIYFTLPISNS